MNELSDENKLAILRDYLDLIRVSMTQSERDYYYSKCKRLISHFQKKDKANKDANSFVNAFSGEISKGE
jgi:hypothetical protein